MIEPGFIALGLASLAGYGFVWFLFIASPARRSLRSVLFLLGTSPLLVVAAVVRFPANLMVIVGLTCIWLLGLWDLHHILAPMEPREVGFDEKLGRIRRSVFEHERRMSAEQWNDAREAHLAVLRTAILQVQTLQPPTPEWAHVSDELIRALEFDADVYAAKRAANTTTGAASFARWEQLKRNWDVVRTTRSRFMR